MKTEKPKKLISLLISLRDESDKSKFQSVYIEIAKEVTIIEFEHSQKGQFNNALYKKLATLSASDYIYSDRSEESLKNLNEVIDMLNDTSILSR